VPVMPEDEAAVKTAVSDALQRGAAGKLLVDYFNDLIRRGLDEVIDGARTGRCELNQLDTTEQTYVGTKLEILLRNDLQMPRGNRDIVLAGHDTDVKWSKEYARWMIGPENRNELCLGICLRDSDSFAVGLFVPTDTRLTRGKGNRDGKKSLLAKARDEDVFWVVERAPLRPNFVAALSHTQRAYIFKGGSIQERVRRLAEAFPMQLVPRSAIATVAMAPDGDPMRRLRQDKHNVDGLRGMRLLSTRQQGREIRQLLAMGKNEKLPADHWLCVPPPRG